MAQQERAERTRSAILDAAAQAFDEQGYAAATLSTILKRAQVTKGALYFHFESKEEIAQAIISEQFIAWPDEHDKPALQSAIDLTHEMAHRLQSDVRVRAGIRLVIEYGTFTDPATFAYKHWIQTVEHLLSSAHEQGDLQPTVSANEFANFLIGSFTGIQVTSEVLASRADLVERITTMWRLVLPGVVAPHRLDAFRPEGSRRTVL